MLLILDRHGPPRLRLRADRPWHRALAHLLAGPLDRRLAAGQPPESSVLLACRAQALVAPLHRRTLAHLLEQHLATADRPVTAVRRASVHPDPDRVMAAGAGIRGVVAMLDRPRPVPARGVAMVSLLLTDGAGPLFDPRHRDALPAALGQVAKHLDPEVTLTPVV